MKVVHMAEDWGVGGLERMVTTLVLGLRRRGIEVEVWGLSRGGPVLEGLDRVGVPTRVFRHRTYIGPGPVASVAAALRAARARLVHTHALPAGVLGRLAALAAGVRRIHHWHTVPQLAGWTALKERLLNRCTQRIVCCSDAVRATLVEHGWARADRCSIVYNGVPIVDREPFRSTAAATRAAWAVADNALVVGTIASLEPHKGHAVLLDAAPRILERYPSTVFVWAGEGSESARLGAEVAVRGLTPSVRRLGHVDDVHALLSAVDVVVLPSTVREGLSMALIEAAMAGCPAVATRVGGNPEAVDEGRTGFVVEPGNPKALADAIATVLGDAHLRARMGRAARERALALFTEDAMVEQTIAIYRAVMSAGGVEAS